MMRLWKSVKRQRQHPPARCIVPLGPRVRLTRQSAVGNAAEDVKGKHEPGLGVGKGLGHLLPLERLVLDAGLVRPEALDRHGLFALRDELGPRRVVGQEDAEHDGPDQRDGPEDDEVPAPLAAAGDGAYAVLEAD